MDNNPYSPTQNSLRERQKQQLRSELISTTLQLIKENGLDATSVDDIVARAGVAKGTFYLYFKAKSDIISAIIEDCIEKLESCISSVVECLPENAHEAIRTVIRAYAAFFEQNSALFTLLHEGMASRHISDETRNNLQTRYNAATSDIYERLIRKGMLQRHYREIDAHLAASALSGMISTMVAKFEGPITVSEECEVALDIFNRGIKHGV